MKATIKKSGAVTGLGLAALMVLSGCGGGASQNAAEKSPVDVVKSAQQNTAEKKSEAVEVKTTATQDQLKKLLSTSDDMSDQEKTDVADALRDSAWDFKARSTNDQALKDVTDPKNLDWSMDIKSGGTDVFQVLETGNNDYYVRVDPAKALELSGTKDAQSELNELKENAASLGSSGKAITALVNGDWLNLDSALSKQLSESAQSKSGVSSDGLSPEEEQKLQNSAMDHSDVTKESDGRYKVSVKVKEFVQANKDLFQKNLDATAKQNGEKAESVDDLIKHLNDKTFDMYYTVDNDEVKKVDVDPMQIADVIEPESSDSQSSKDDLKKLQDTELPLSIDYTGDAGNFEAPSGAVKVTEQDLKELSS